MHNLKCKRYIQLHRLNFFEIFFSGVKSQIFLVNMCMNGDHIISGKHIKPFYILAIPRENNNSLELKHMYIALNAVVNIIHIKTVTINFK